MRERQGRETEGNGKSHLDFVLGKKASCDSNSCSFRWDYLQCLSLDCVFMNLAGELQHSLVLTAIGGITLQC